MRKITACLIALIWMLFLAVPVQAAIEYKLLYDGTESFDRDMCWEIGAGKLMPLSDTYKTQIRIDIVSNTEEYCVADYAELFYLNFDYGYKDTKDGILLMLHIAKQDDEDVALVDYSVYCDGENKETLDGFLTLVEPHLGSYLLPSAWEGDMESDNLALQSLANAYIECVEGFLSGELEPIYPEEITKQGVYVTDDSDLLTGEDWTALEEEAAAVSAKHNAGIYVAIVENFADDGSKTVEEAAEKRYKANQMGHGLDKDGILLLISMEEGDYAILPRGSITQKIDEEQIGSLCDILLEKFASGRPAKGLMEYVRHCDDILSGTDTPAETTFAADAGQEASGSGKIYVIGVLAICVVLFLLILREQRRNVKEKAKD